MTEVIIRASENKIKLFEKHLKNAVNIFESKYILYKESNQIENFLQKRGVYK